MKKLSLIVDERELSTIRAALFLLQEQVDALPEDLAEMLAEHGKPMTEVEVEQLSLCLNEQANPTQENTDRTFTQIRTVVDVVRHTTAPFRSSA